MAQTHLRLRDITGQYLHHCEDLSARCTEWALRDTCDNILLPFVCQKSCNNGCANLVGPVPDLSLLQTNASINGTSPKMSLAFKIDDSVAAGGSTAQMFMGLENGHTSSTESLCVDLNQDCRTLVDHNGCYSNPVWMKENCRRSCRACPKCSDRSIHCGFWADVGECESNPRYMRRKCAMSCGRCVIDDSDSQLDCADKESEEICQVRKQNGECESFPGWMIRNCAKTCNRCDLRNAKYRCRPQTFNDPNYTMENVLKKPGDLSNIFKRILKKYPGSEAIVQPDNGPWIIKLPQFTSAEEREALLNTTLPKVTRSMTVYGVDAKTGAQKAAIVPERTSSNSWCDEECMDDPIVKELIERISSLLRISAKNFEMPQVLQYKVSQKYDAHHDASYDELNELSGLRILTLFMYLSDVEEGGETFFDQLDLKVKPERGMAILWPSVMDSDPYEIDMRTTHAALPVIKGEKLAVNVWIHQRDFATPSMWHCPPLTDDE